MSHDFHSEIIQAAERPGAQLSYELFDAVQHLYARALPAALSSVSHYTIDLVAASSPHLTAAERIAALQLMGRHAHATAHFLSFLPADPHTQLGVLGGMALAVSNPAKTRPAVQGELYLDPRAPRSEHALVAALHHLGLATANGSTEFLHRGAADAVRISEDRLTAALEDVPSFLHLRGQLGGTSINLPPVLGGLALGLGLLGEIEAGRA